MKRKNPRSPWIGLCCRGRIVFFQAAALSLFAVIPTMLPDLALECALSPLYAAEKTNVSQTTIDSLSARALYLLNDVEDLAGGQTRREAVAAADVICENLRQIAENDVNRQYILWKVEELRDATGSRKERHAG